MRQLIATGPLSLLNAAVKIKMGGLGDPPTARIERALSEVRALRAQGITQGAQSSNQRQQKAR